MCLDPRVLDPTLAGREFDEAFLAELAWGVDPCGENGEFHTFVWDAPMYRERISCRTGEVVTRGGFVYCDIVPTRGTEDLACGATHAGPVSGE